MQALHVDTTFISVQSPTKFLMFFLSSPLSLMSPCSSVPCFNAEKHTLCLVSFLHLFSHYSSIAAKLVRSTCGAACCVGAHTCCSNPQFLQGVSLAKCRDEEQIVFVDCLTRLLSESQAQTSRIASSTTNQGTVVFSFGQ